MVKEKSGSQNDENYLMELYRVADENHRFYVSRRFTIISLYFPLMTIVLSAFYFFAVSYDFARILRILTVILGLVLTLFLYSLENRNWILSRICSDSSKDIGNDINGDNNLHVKLSKSFSDPLPKYSTCLDRLVRRIANTQHKAVSILTVLLLFYWISLGIIPEFL